MTTIRDVAKFAGVSPITVSRVVNRLANVNPETRAKVEKAIEELGYVRNLAASSLRSKETYTLALILPDITNTFWTDVARGVEDAAQSDGYSVLLCNTDENPEKFTKYLKAVLQQRVDGVLVAPITTDPSHLSALGDMKVPTVVLDRRLSNWDGDSVYCDSIASSQALVQHLLSLGHKRIAILSGPASTSTAEDRVAGYCLSLCKAGIEVDQRLILRGEYRSSSGRAMTRELLASDLAPSAIVATNNAIAAGALDELKEQGRKVPEEIALVGFDEIPEMDRFFPFLTTVTQPAYDMGINATQLLLSRINANGPIRARQVILPTRLILRYSCGRFIKTQRPESGVNFTNLPDLSTNQLVMPLEDSDRDLLQTIVPGLTGGTGAGLKDPHSAKPDRKRLMHTLNFEKTDRPPYLDGRGAGKRVMEFVLDRGLRPSPDGLNILAEDAIQFAQQMGIDAISCDFSWQLGALASAPEEDLLERVRREFPAPSLAGQLSALENLLNAAEGSGVGIYARFNGFFETAFKVFQSGDPFIDLQTAVTRHNNLEKLMDLLVKHQERVMRAVCDRFGRDLCFISIQDDLMTRRDIVTDQRLFQSLVIPRLRKMITPAIEHALPVALDTSAGMEWALPDLHKAGIKIIQFTNPDLEALERLVGAWHGKIVFIGGLPASRLGLIPRAEVDEMIRKYHKKFARHSGFAFGPDEPLPSGDEYPPQNFVNMLRTVQQLSGD